MLRSILYHDKKKKPGLLFVHFHGGGWTFGMPEYGEPYAEMLVKELGCSVVSVGYRLGPESMFPAAAEDAIDAVKWVCKASLIANSKTQVLHSESSKSACMKEDLLIWIGRPACSRLPRRPKQRVHGGRNLCWW